MINDCSEDKKLSNMIFMITFCDGESCNIFIILLSRELTLRVEGNEAEALIIYPLMKKVR